MCELVPWRRCVQGAATLRWLLPGDSGDSLAVAPSSEELAVYQGFAPHKALPLPQGYRLLEGKRCQVVQASLCSMLAAVCSMGFDELPLSLATQGVRGRTLRRKSWCSGSGGCRWDRATASLHGSCLLRCWLLGRTEQQPCKRGLTS